VSASRYAPGLDAYLAAAGVSWWAEDDAAWAVRAGRLAAQGGRIRLVGSSVHDTAEAVGGSVDVGLYDHPVTSAGRVEMLPFLREQAVCITAHRFGTPRHYDVPLLAPAMRI